VQRQASAQWKQADAQSGQRRKMPFGVLSKRASAALASSRLHPKYETRKEGNVSSHQVFHPTSFKYHYTTTTGLSMTRAGGQMMAKEEYLNATPTFLLCCQACQPQQKKTKAGTDPPAHK
jgi:hypothetical protein